MISVFRYYNANLNTIRAILTRDIILAAVGASLCMNGTRVCRLVDWLVVGTLWLSARFNVTSLTADKSLLECFFTR